MPFLIAEDKVINIHHDEFHYKHLLNKQYQYIQEKRKYVLINDIDIVHNQPYGLLGAQIGGVDA